jgi:Tfp pilus assembly protein PilN
MRKNINLFSKQIKKLRQKQKWRRRLGRILMGAVLSVGLAVIALSGYNLVLIRANQRLDNRIKVATKRIEELRPIESQQVYLASKLSSFASLLKTQEQHQAMAETIFSILPNGTSLKGFTVEKSGEVVLAGSVMNFTALQELLANVRSSQSRLPIMAAEMQQVSYSEEGEIIFSLKLVLGVPQGGDRG